MDLFNKVLVLELTYRLVVALNMTVRKAEMISWMESWNTAAFDCAQKLKGALLSSITGNGDADYLFIKDVNNIVAGLSRGYAGIVVQGYSGFYEYQHMLELVHRIAHASGSPDLGLSECYKLGRQLAFNDLQRHFPGVDTPGLPKNSNSVPPFPATSGTTIAAPLLPKNSNSVPPFPATSGATIAAPVLPKNSNSVSSFSSVESFTRFFPNWPQDPSFNNVLIRYEDNRQKFRDSDSFSEGPLLSLAQSIICPSHFPSTAWCWRDWEEGNPWRLFLAGRHFPSPKQVAVEDKNDRAFVILLEAMAKDKKAGRAPAECGWVPRKELWPDTRTANTRSKAWSKLTGKTLAVLGKFETDGGKGKNRDTGSRGRLPAAFAEPSCRIFIEKLK